LSAVVIIIIVFYRFVREIVCVSCVASKMIIYAEKSTINTYDCKLSNYSSVLIESIGIRMKRRRAVVPSTLRTIGDIESIESGYGS